MDGIIDDYVNASELFLKCCCCFDCNYSNTLLKEVKNSKLSSLKQLESVSTDLKCKWRSRSF